MTVAGAQLREKPLLVPALIAVNVIVFVITAVQAGSMQNYSSAIFADFAMLPVTVAAGQWWRLLSAGFLHIGVIHLAVNMVALWVIGRDLELLLGRLRFASVYALSLLGGSVGVLLFGAADSPVAGASGAIYGLMGGIAVAALRLKVSMRPVLVVIGLNLVLSITIPGISLLGHIGGLVVGTIATAALVYAPAQRRNLMQAGALVGLLVVLVALVLTKDALLGDVSCIGSGFDIRCSTPQ